MKNFWLELALRLAHTALGIFLDRHAAKSAAANIDSTAAPVAA